MNVPGTRILVLANDRKIHEAIDSLLLKIKYRIEVQGRTARLYVHGAEQPCLIVNDLKLAPTEGGVALWVGPGTEGYFSNLKITRK